MTGEDLARAAESFAGCRFRLHGRDPETGIDCIGLIELSLTAIGRPVELPRRYALRTGDWAGLETFASTGGFGEARGPAMPGDISLYRPAESQMHFAISGLRPGTLVEAHAGLRRVVISPEPDSSLLVRRWRMM